MGGRLADDRSCGRSVGESVISGTAERAGIAWRRLSAAGIGDGRPRTVFGPLPRPHTLQVKTEPLVIRWNTILQTAVDMLGGTDLAYTRERANGFIQACVRFRIPLDKDQTFFQDVEAAGIKCSEVWEADNSAAISALGQLEGEPFHIRIVDISRLQYEEMQKICHHSLLNSGEVRRGMKLLLSDWEDTMAKTETCYKGLYEEVVENTCRGVNAMYVEMMGDVANHTYELTRASYLNFTTLSCEVEKVKAVEWDVRARAEHHFHGRSHDRPKIDEPCLPHEMKLCMKKILDEMIKSLGWDDPTYKFAPSGTDIYDCEVLLVGKRDAQHVERNKLLVASGKGLSEDEALEIACQNAVLLLEREMSICLVDINYSKRSHAHLYVSEAQHVLDLALSTSCKIVAEWESLIDGLEACVKQCWDVVEQHPEKEPWNQAYNAKCECAGVLADLHATCLSDLVLAKERHSLISTWTGQQVHA